MVVPFICWLSFEHSSFYYCFAWKVCDDLQENTCPAFDYMYRLGIHRTLIWPGIHVNNIRFYNHIDENFTSYYCLRVVWWFTRKFMPCFWLCVPIRNAPNFDLTGFQVNNIRFYNHIDENFTSYYCLTVWVDIRYIPNAID